MGSFSRRLLETLASDPEIADDLKVVNKMIDDFNLQVPWINAQMFHIQLDREFDVAIEEGKQLEMKRKEEEALQKQEQHKQKIIVHERQKKTKYGFRDRLVQMLFGNDQR